MADFNYHLPDELIARFPPAVRGASRLLVLPPGGGGQGGQEGPPPLDRHFRDLGDHLPEGAHLVLNHSKVFAARTFGREVGGGGGGGGGGEAVEVMFLNPERPHADPARALAAPCRGQVWRAMVRRVAGPRARAPWTCPLQAAAAAGGGGAGGAGGGEGAVEVEIVHPGMGCARLFAAFGEVPLPPYFRRPTAAADRETYQTVYASAGAEGSVAAPTAGLHFTPEVLEDLGARGFRTGRLSLHVGSGTFRPVVAERVAEHGMHAEPGGGGGGARGTTAVRTLESLYWLGAQRSWGAPRGGAEGGEGGGAAAAGAVEAYRWAVGARRAAVALRAAAELAQEGGGAAAVRGTTALCAAPGYRFRLADALVTNFHQPDSTLLLLAAALVGGPGRLRAAYAHAVHGRYRFLSYGDACLL
ncbi:unnamed protein product, partial [Heterosigma akashiwo]